MDNATVGKTGHCRQQLGLLGSTTATKLHRDSSNTVEACDLSVEYHRVEYPPETISMTGEPDIMVEGWDAAANIENNQ